MPAIVFFRRLGSKARRHGIRVRGIVGRVEVAQWSGNAIRTNNAHMEALEAPWMRHSATMRDNLHIMLHVEAIIGYSHGLVAGIEAFLQSFVVSCDAGGASILIAFEGLNAAERELEAAGRVDKSRPGAKRPRRLGRS